MLTAESRTTRNISEVALKPIYLFLAFIQLTKMSLIVNAALSLESKQQQLKRKVLRVAVFQYPPSMIITKQSDGTFEFKGIAFEIINYIADALGIRYDFVFLGIDEIKKYGSGPAQINMLKNEVVDLAPCGVAISHSKYEEVDLSIPWLIQPIRMVVPWPEDGNENLIAITRPFEPPVWITLIGIMIAVAVTLTLTSCVYKKYVEKKTSSGSATMNFIENIVLTVANITNHTYKMRLTRRGSIGVLIVFGVWCLMTVVISNAYYSGALLSFLTVNKVGSAINSLDELVNSKQQCKLVVQAGSDLANRFLDAKSSGTYKIIGDSLRANPDTLMYKFQQDEVTTKLMTGSFATIHLDIIVFGIIDAAYRKNGRKCRLTLAKEKIDTYSISQALTKNGPYTKAINQQLQTLIEIGVMEYLIKKPMIDQCKIENQKASARQKSLSLLDMASAFIALLLGISLSLFVFLIELIYKRIKDHHKNIQIKQNLPIKPEAK